FGMTPAAFAVAPLATQAKTPMVIMNAATSAITTKSPYIVRVSQTLPQVTAPVAQWAAENGIETVYTVVADYGPGHDAEKQFTESFTAGGGTIIGGVRTPVSSPDFSSYLQRAKDAAPDAVFLFVPSGEQGVAFLKGFKARALAKQGIQLIATGDLTDEDVLDSMGEPAEGVITSFHYSDVHDSPENKAYVQAYQEAYQERPNFMSVAGYDGMHLIYTALEKTDGDSDGDRFMEAIKGMRWISPRGEVEIDADTRDIIQTIYMREVKRVGDALHNVEFDQIDRFRDPGKE
ncbi:MAG TPA: ABC transporter substrate-binding protein, partial [Burkholderiaceae bacterium]|nr:ABC transporter substrate-binding protein [Burkholderiaceae bacterium]